NTVAKLAPKTVAKLEPKTVAKLEPKTVAKLEPKQKVRTRKLAQRPKRTRTSAPNVHSKRTKPKRTVEKPTRGKNPNSYLMLGSGFQQKGQTKKALAAYRQYLKLAPSGRYASDVRKIIRRLQNQ
ncbi:MAG: hypothetical protein KC609_10935, partial [Myxococcales bacterium]|nr:hypothetical protein [Myxococcales bacterium]